MHVIILYFFLSFSNAENTCPDVKPVENFDFYEIGTWYEIGRYENPLEEGTCVVMNSAQDRGGYSQCPVLRVSEVDNHELHVYDGILQNPELNCGVLDYIFEEYRLVMNVISTNYTDYAVEYNCWYNETSDKITEQGWIMSRTKDLNHDTRDQIIGLLQDTNILSTDKIIWDDFSEESCSYDSENIDTSLPDDLKEILEELCY